MRQPLKIFWWKSSGHMKSLGLWSEGWERVKRAGPAVVEGEWLRQMDGARRHCPSTLPQAASLLCTHIPMYARRGDVWRTGLSPTPPQPSKRRPTSAFLPSPLPLLSLLGIRKPFFPSYSSFSFPITYQASLCYFRVPSN